MNLRQGVATPRDLLRELEEASVLDRRRADAVAGGAGRLDEGPRLRHRRRQPHVSHGDSGALARGAGRRRAARRQPPRFSPGSWWSSTARASEIVVDPDDGDARARRRARRDDRPPAADGRRAAGAPGRDGRRRAHPARGQHRVPGRSGGRALRRRRRHRAVPLRVPADRRAVAAVRRRGRSSTRSTAACSRAWRRRRSPSAPSTWTRSSSRCASARLALAASWIADAERASRQGLRGLRLSLTRPDLFRTQLRALLRAARHGSLRIMFPFVSGVEQVREARRLVAEARGRARDDAASRAARCRSA